MTCCCHDDADLTYVKVKRTSATRAKFPSCQYGYHLLIMAALHSVVGLSETIVSPAQTAEPTEM